MKMFEKNFIITLLLMLLCFSNVRAQNTGVGTVIPTNKLHVVDAKDPVKLGGIQASTTSNDKSIVIDDNGVLKTSLPDNSFFMGNIGVNFTVPQQTSTANVISKIILQNEFVDKGKEYDPATGLFTPLSSGAYLFEMQITSDVTRASTNDEFFRTVMGFAESGEPNQWVGRFQVMLPSFTPLSFYVKGIAVLSAGKSYFFGIANGVSNGTGTIYATTSGGTGNGQGTFFAIQRIL